MRRAVAAVLAVAAAGSAGCGGGDERDAVADYIRAANGVQARSAPAFRQANVAYQQFAVGRFGDARPAREVVAAERALRAALAEVRALRPPPPARLLHVRLERVYDLNARFAGETTLLARYVPAASEVIGPLAEITDDLRRRLARARQPATQAAALARYRRAINRQLTRLRRLDPPPVLAATDEDQKDRLLNAASLAGRLRTAVLARDARRVARLLLRFRRVGVGAVSGLTADSVAAYRRRGAKITRATTRLLRERVRLERELG